MSFFSSYVWGVFDTVFSASSVIFSMSYSVIPRLSRVSSPRCPYTKALEVSKRPREIAKPEVT